MLHDLASAQSIYQGYQMDEDMIGEVCGMHGRDKNIHTEFWLQNFKQKSRRSLIAYGSNIDVDLTREVAFDDLTGFALAKIQTNREIR